MPEPLKYMYNREFVEGLALDIQKVYKQYQVDKFIQSVLNKDWDKKELKERMRHISNNLKEFLPDDYSKALKILVETTKLHRIKKAELEKIDFCDLVFPDFVEVNGLDYFDISLDALEEFTKVSSSEGAIRHFILKDQKNTFKRIMKWSKGSNLMVRRLASEGCRPRLPWTIGLKELQKDPTPIIPILENLVLDSSEFVRRSVANNLNDISKDNPNVVIDFIKKWKGKNKDTDRLLKHGARTLLKKGNIEVLSLFGFASKSKRIEISNFELKKKKIKNGEDLLFSFEFEHKEKFDSKMRLEYGIYYLKKNGKQNRKIFILSEKVFSPNQKILIKRKQSFKNMTTIVHYTGAHKISILVNGIEYAEHDFILL